MSAGTDASILEATRLGLARLALGQAHELTRAFKQATAASARALNVERVGIWFFSSDGSELRCASMYEMKENKHSAGAVLLARDYPQYLRALDSRRAIVAHDARSAPETSELTSYFDAHGIRSLLDSPIFRGGEVVGVVCHEHVGPARVWSSSDRDFATSVADLLAVLLEQATRLDIEAALTAQRDRLARAEKVDALSRFGAGLAHDFNNVLQSIMLRVAALEQARTSDRDFEAETVELLNDAERGSHLVRQLLTYAKVDTVAPRPVDLVELVTAATPTLSSLLSGAWTLHTNIPDRPVVVWADRSQLEQVLTNLVMNARDAMPAGGQVAVRLAADGEHAWLTIHDTGIGMDEQTLNRIFDPFFTTKRQGTGLGLSIVQSILQQNGGSIEVQSVPGGGTTFSVKLPHI